MNLDAIFEDIQSQIAAEDLSHEFVHPVANRVLLLVGQQPSVELVAPILGNDFVCGYEPATANWFCARSSKVAQLKFDQVDDPELVGLRIQAITFEGLLKTFALPAAVQVKVTEREMITATLTGIANDLLFIREPGGRVVAIGLEAIDFLRLIEDTEMNELQEWRNR